MTFLKFEKFMMQLATAQTLVSIQSNIRDLQEYQSRRNLAVRHYGSKNVAGKPEINSLFW